MAETKDILQSKLLKDLSIDEKLELAARALCETARVSALSELRFSELLDRLEVVVKRLGASSWTKAINAELERRERERASSG